MAKIGEVYKYIYPNHPRTGHLYKVTNLPYKSLDYTNQHETLYWGTNLNTNTLMCAMRANNKNYWELVSEDKQVTIMVKSRLELIDDES